MTEYVCLTLIADPGETEALFRSRLTSLWSHMLKTSPADYEMIYSEAVEFETSRDIVTRRYMVDPAVLPALLPILESRSLFALPVDADELYSKAEASSNEYFQIDH